ncbi:hypothetical protein TIFTF001_010104 [Ficus carica]|uniref:Peptidase M48 domain-containing protein n=1 Tax=Ficus carica TaxID=3494 RepID=A0AA88ABL7_FICCA|nr:hypothetical protein TIFTF001_010104 [Ficus carica]
MGTYRRSKLALDAFRSFSSRILPKNPIQYPTTTSGSSFATASGGAKFFGFSSPISRTTVSQYLGQAARSQNNYGRPFLAGGKRFYYVDRHHVQHFRVRGPRRWFQNPRTVLIVVLVGSGVIITVYFGNLETVPYTNRRHFVLLSKSMERKLGETQFEQMKAAFKGKILPAIHPESIRVRLIANDIVKALQRGLSQERVWSDMGYASPESFGTPPHEEDAAARETLRALKESDGEETVVEGKWFRDDEILDDRWVQETRKKGKERGSRPETSHLEGSNWEILVVDEPVFIMPDIVNTMSTLFLRLPFSRRLSCWKSKTCYRVKYDNFTVGLNSIKLITRAAIRGCSGQHVCLLHVNSSILLRALLRCCSLNHGDWSRAGEDIFATESCRKIEVLLLLLKSILKMEMEADYIGLLLMASAGCDPRVAPRVYEKLGKLTGDSKLRDYLSTHPSGKKRAQLLAQAKVMEEALNIYRDVLAGRGVEGFL